MDGGREASVDELLDTIRYNDFNVTLSGGDPLYHPKEVASSYPQSIQRLRLWLTDP